MGTTEPESSPDSWEQFPLAAVLVGGRARRMGGDKVFLPLGGVPLIQRVHRQLSAVASNVVAVGGHPRAAELSMPVIPDRYPGADSMGGIATALHHAAHALGEDTWVLVVACDMPFLRPELLRHLGSLRSGHDVVVPRVEAGYEPLCALYRTTCLPALEALIAAGNLRIRGLFSQLRSREVPEPELRRFDPDLRSFLNMNRADDLARAMEVLGMGPAAQ